jgi:hypothetical protein
VDGRPIGAGVTLDRAGVTLDRAGVTLDPLVTNTGVALDLLEAVWRFADHALRTCVADRLATGPAARGPLWTLLPDPFAMWRCAGCAFRTGRPLAVGPFACRALPTSVADRFATRPAARGPLWALAFDGLTMRRCAGCAFRTGRPLAVRPLAPRAFGTCVADHLALAMRWCTGCAFRAGRRGDRQRGPGG